ncbi:MAG: heme ABC transporter ATP-binding protein, partial [Deltaproteobacteria bacterium]|nr:heme ABC transporter ATP-binding protein [Deltaproteobacteria bacterium]
AQPTRGVDIAAAAEIHKRLLAARAAGMAVLLVSADLGELRLLSDRIVVMLRGRINGEFTREEATEAKLGALMTATAGGTSTSTEGGA